MLNLSTKFNLNGFESVFYSLICNLLARLLHFNEILSKLKEEEEVTDVCRAIEEIKKEAAEEACRILKYSVKDYENAKKKFAI